MMENPRDDPVLQRFRAAVRDTYGERVERVVLFGSRARGDEQEDTDYDVAVFLRDMRDRMTEMNCLADLSTDVLYDTGEFHAMPYRAGFYNDPREPLMNEIRAKGIDL